MDKNVIEKKQLDLSKANIIYPTQLTQLMK